MTESPDDFLAVDGAAGRRASVSKREVRATFSAVDRVEIEILEGLAATISGVDLRGRSVRRRWEFEWGGAGAAPRSAEARIVAEPHQEFRAGTTASPRRVRTAADGRAIVRGWDVAEPIRWAVEAATADGVLRSVVVVFRG